MAHGVFVDGVWHSEWYDTAKTGGRFVPTAPAYRNWVTADGSAGPSGEAGFAAERGRYHLYVSLACPFAHRTIIFRKLKGLEDMISLSPVEPVMGEQGWEFGAGATADPLNGTRSRHGQRQATPRRDLSARQSALHRPRLGAGALGQEAADDRQQRIARDHPHAELGLRRLNQ